MNRKVAAVLLCTFLALCAATVWVPCRDYSGENEWHYRDGTTRAAYDHAPGELYWRGVWTLGIEDVGYRITMSYWWEARIAWVWLLAQLGVILAAGGLLALVLRTRAARGAA